MEKGAAEPMPVKSVFWREGIHTLVLSFLKKAVGDTVEQSIAI